MDAVLAAPTERLAEFYEKSGLIAAAAAGLAAVGLLESESEPPEAQVAVVAEVDWLD